MRLHRKLCFDTTIFRKIIALLTIGYTQCMTSHMTQFSLIKIYSNVYVRAFFLMCVVIFAHDPEQNENSNKFFF